jgi:hypothetical protein
LEIAVPASDRQQMDTIIALQLDGDALKIPAMVVPPAYSSGLFTPNVKRVVFLGDSITHLNAESEQQLRDAMKSAK